eukprot:1729589-Rhodomonas_salina.2
MEDEHARAMEAKRARGLEVNCKETLDKISKNATRIQVLRDRQIALDLVGQPRDDAVEQKIAKLEAKNTKYMEEFNKLFPDHAIGCM